MDSHSESEKLSIRVRRALEDMAAIHQSLLSMPEQPAEGSAPEMYLDLELAGELKSMVDVVHQHLWAYIEALSAKSGRSPLEVMRWYKTELAVEMLRSVRPPASATQAPASELEQLINSALVISSQYSTTDRHC